MVVGKNGYRRWYRNPLDVVYRSASGSIRGVTTPRNTSSSNHMAVASPAHGTVSPFKGTPLIISSGRPYHAPSFLTEVLQAAYRMLTRAVSIIGLRDAMHTAGTEVAKPGTKTRDDCAEVKGDKKQDRAEIRAFQRSCELGDEVIEAAVAEMFPRKRA